MARLGRFINYADPNSFAMQLRRRRSIHVSGLIDRIFQAKGSCRVLDLGGTALYWTIFDREYLRARSCSIVVLNVLKQGESDDIFTFEDGDAADLSRYADGSFDLVHANSVVEHMGTWGKMEAFALEVRRVGERYYIQTPNFWFPVEPHFRLPFLHWLPLALGARLLKWTERARKPTIGHAVRWLESNRTLDVAQLRCLFPDAVIKTEWLFLMPKSLMAIRG